MSGLFGLLSARTPVRSTSFLDSLFEEGKAGPSIPPDIPPLVENNKEDDVIVDDPGVDITKTKPPKVVVITEPGEGGVVEDSPIGDPVTGDHNDTPPRPSKAMPRDPDPTPWTQVQRKVAPETATVSGIDILFPLPPPDYQGWLRTNPPDGVLYPYHLPGGKRFTLSLQPKIKGPRKPSLNLEVGTHQFRKSGVGAGYFEPKRLRESLWEKKPWMLGCRQPPAQTEIPSPPLTTRWSHKKRPIDKHVRWWTHRVASATDSRKQKKKCPPRGSTFPFPETRNTKELHV